MNIEIVVACIGAGSIGSNFIKEFGRFMSCYKDDKIKLKLLVIDHSYITNDDLLTQPFIESDIGWNKAGTIVGAIKEWFPNVSGDVYSSNKQIRNGKQISSLISGLYTNNSKKTTRIIYLIDTIGNAQTKSAAGEFFEKEDNAILLNVYPHQTMGAIEICIRANGILVGSENSKRKPLNSHSDSIKYMSSLMCSHLLLSLVCNGIVNKKIDVGLIRYNAMQYSSKFNVDTIAEMKAKKSEGNNDEEHTVVVCMGAGGTGGNFSKEFARILFGNKSSKTISFVLIDGDHVEEKNQERQPFTYEDVMQNKANTLVASMNTTLPYSNSCSIKSYPHYIDTLDQLEEAITLGSNPNKYNKVYLIGCVDNHRARQVMEEYFDKANDIVYIDSANEYSNGEIVVGVKEKGELISPSRAFYYPDVLTDKSKRASELSCGVINISAPQHQITNLVAAHLLLTVIVKSIHYGCTDKGIIYFDAFTYFSRFQSFIKEEAA